MHIQIDLKLIARILLIYVAININLPACCYSQISGLQLFDDIARINQVYGNNDSSVSFCVRPNYMLPYFDSLLRSTRLKQNDSNYSQRSIKNIILLPVVLQQQYNTHHAYGWNDGSMIPSKGYGSQISFGATWKKGIISIQLRPEIVYTYNRYFSTFPFKQIDNIWYAYSEVNNAIDAPDRFGYKRYTRIFSGQSSFRLNYYKLSLGVSSENLWWGPGVRNSLIMSNNAPGFPHLTFNTLKPVTSFVGSVEWQLMSGILKGSNIIPDDTSRRLNGELMYRPKQFNNRYINGVVIAWQPKWTKGLFLGFSRVFYQYLTQVEPSLDGYIPVVGKFFKRNLPSEDVKKRDQMLSFFFRLILPKEKAEFYGEFGRNDHSYNARDFLLEPEHSRAYVIGFSKTFDRRKKDMQLFSEITSLQMTPTTLIRAGQSWYVHYQVREGYTNRGQVLGAAVGPGGASQTVGLKWISGFDRTGVTAERIVHNNDFYYNAFAPLGSWTKHWVDLSLSLNKSWKTKRIIYDARLSFIRSLNYQWYYMNVFNCSASLGVAYTF